MKHFSKKWVIAAVIVVGIIGIILWSSSKKAPTDQGNTVTVKRADILQEVSVTGRVKPSTAVELSFEKAGRIDGVYVNVGDHVAKGTLLAEVDSTAAQASVLEAEAELEGLNRGTRPEEITVKEAELAKATQDLANAYNDITDTVNDAFTKSDDALHVKTAGIFSGSKSSSYTITFSVCDSQLALNTMALRTTEESDIGAWRTELASFPAVPTHDDLSALLKKADEHVQSLKAFLETLNHALTLDCTIANSSLDTYRTNVNTARTNITTVLSAISTEEQSVASLALAVAKTNDELSLMRAGTTSDAIDAQKARLLSAQGELRKYRIYAPADGLITRNDAKVGESASLATPVIDIISDDLFEMEAYVAESDVAKIAVGDSAKVTLDAYGSDVVFGGTVVAIDPAETIIDNVPTYKTTLHFTQKDPRIKSGMTANIDIATGSRKNVLVLPQRAVGTKNDQKAVTVVNPDQSTTTTPVTVGLKGSDGAIEILSGVKEGQTVRATFQQ